MATFTIATMADMKESDTTAADQNNLANFVEELKCSNAVLQAEIDMFERYIKSINLFVTESASPMTASRQHLLTLDQKCEVAQSGYRVMAEDLKRETETSESVLDHYKATLEEADIHLTEVKRECCKFERDIVKALQDKKSVTMNTEKVTRFIEDRIRAKVNLIKKFQLKNDALHALERQLLPQLKQQEEMSKGLTEVDIDLLKTENIKCRRQIDEQNHKYLSLKLLAGKTLHTLNLLKKKLQTLTQESDVLSSDIALRMKLLVKIEEETKQAEEERSKAEALNRKLRGQLADFHVPHVLQYITVKESHSQLEKTVRAWERKVEIAEMALKSYTKAWDKVRIAAGAGPMPARKAAIYTDLCGL